MSLHLLTNKITAIKDYSTSACEKKLIQFLYLLLFLKLLISECADLATLMMKIIITEIVIKKINSKTKKRKMKIEFH